MGQSEVSAKWCAEDGIPSSILEEYKNGIEPQRELQQLNFSGQVAVTAIATHPDLSDVTKAKKPRTDRFNTSTNGYTLYCFIKIFVIMFCS